MENDADDGAGWGAPGVPSVASGPETLRRWLSENRPEALKAFQGLLKGGFADVCGYRGQSVSEAAEDLLGEVAAIALKKADAFDPARPPKAWLTKIALHVALRWRRAEAIRYRTFEPIVDADNAELSVADLTDAVVDGALVDGLLDLLNADRRRIVEMVVVQDLDYAEIGRRLGIAEGTARVRCHRALVWLRGELAQRGVRGVADLDRLFTRDRRTENEP